MAVVERSWLMDLPLVATRDRVVDLIGSDGERTVNALTRHSRDYTLRDWVNAPDFQLQRVANLGPRCLAALRGTFGYPAEGEPSPLGDMLQAEVASWVSARATGSTYEQIAWGSSGVSAADVSRALRLPT